MRWVVASCSAKRVWSKGEVWSGRTCVGRKAKLEMARAGLKSDPPVGGHGERRQKAFANRHPQLQGGSSLRPETGDSAEAGRPEVTAKTPKAVPTRTRTLRSRSATHAIACKEPRKHKHHTIRSARWASARRPTTPRYSRRRSGSPSTAACRYIETLMRHTRSAGSGRSRSSRPRRGRETPATP